MKTDAQIRTDIMNALVQCRKEKGITQNELAADMGKTPTAIASWEQGISLPSPQMLYRLSKYYGKSIDYMYGDADK